MDGDRTLEEIFADTCILLNFVQREWERDYSTVLVESDAIDIVVSDHVVDELEDVAERRQDIYEDLVEFLIATEAAIEEYDPGDRRVYIGANDAGHVRDIQMDLADIDDRREVLRRLRKFVRAAGRRIEHLRATLEGSTIDPLPPFDLKLAVDRILDHSADAKVVTDAAAWTADGGSGVLVTDDNDDIAGNEDEITELLVDEQGPDWVIQIMHPDGIVSDLRLRGQAE